MTMGTSLLQLTPSERSQLVRAVQPAGVPQDAAVPAFYSIVAGETAAATKLMEQAGAAAGSVRAAFVE